MASASEPDQHRSWPGSKTVINLTMGVKSVWLSLSGASRSKAEADVIGNPASGLVHQDGAEQIGDLGAGS